MRRKAFFTFLLLAFISLAGCVSESDSPALYVGMSRDRLRARFGEPVRIEHARSGGEDWYYSVVSRQNPDVQVSHSNDGTSVSTSASMTISDENIHQEQPVHLSPDGYVTAPLPVVSPVTSKPASRGRIKTGHSEVLNSYQVS